MATGGEVGGRRVVHPVARLHGGPAEPDGEHGLAHPRRADQKDVGGVLQEAQRGQLLHELAVDRWLGVEVEVGDAPGRGQAGEAGKAGLPAGEGGLHLHGQQALQPRRVAELLGSGSLQGGGQHLGGGRQPDGGEVSPQRLVGSVLPSVSPAAK